MSDICHLDCETTSTELDRRAWEIGLITPDGAEYEWLIDIRDLKLPRADPVALGIGRFWQRHPQADRVPLLGNLAGVAVQFPDSAPPGWARREAEVLAEVAELIPDQAVVHGSNPDFDRYTLWPRMAAHGIKPRWYYSPEDVARAAYWWLRGQGVVVPPRANGRVKSDDVSRACGVDPDSYDRHTALGDCRWLRDLHAVIAGSP